MYYVHHIPLTLFFVSFPRWSEFIVRCAHFRSSLLSISLSLSISCLFVWVLRTRVEFNFSSSFVKSSEINSHKNWACADVFVLLLILNSDNFNQISSIEQHSKQVLIWFYRVFQKLFAIDMCVCVLHFIAQITAVVFFFSWKYFFIYQKVVFSAALITFNNNVMSALYSRILNTMRLHFMWHWYWCSCWCWCWFAHIAVVCHCGFSFQ